MTEESFFNEQTDQSLVKTTIIRKYFDAWANVMIATQKRHQKFSQKIAYIDLFAGPGRYKDGTMSTPLEVLQIALEKPEIRDRLVTMFNDKDENFSKSLEKAINEFPNVEALRYRPKVMNHEVGDNIVSAFEEMSFIPTLFFVDPWGYRGLSLRLINSVLKDWGCDCIFFFNYNRINMGLSNPYVNSHLNDLFGTLLADKLRDEVEHEDPYKRELIIVEGLCQAIKSYGNRFTLPFRFKHASGKRTMHYLVFVSKHFKGYEIMKEIMAKESSSENQDVPSFEYSPADFLPKTSLLFQLSRPLDDLKETLLDRFSGRTIMMLDIYEEHNVDTPYIKSNYKKALRELEEEKKISPSKHKKGSFADKVIVKFP